MNQFDPTGRQEDPGILAGANSPIFIISTPRCGSTLLYQVLCRGAEVAFFSNLMSLLPRFSVRLSAASLARAALPNDSYPSGDYGFLPGLYAPSEAGKIVDRWFDPDRVPEHRDPVRRNVAAITRRTGRPLLIKSPSLALKLPTVLNIFPEARIIFLTREPTYVIQSLLKGQTNTRIADDRWEGIRPPGFSDRSGDGVEAQAAWQVAELLRLIESAISVADAGRVARVDYGAFCDEPRGALAEIGGTLSIDVSPSNLPKSFPASQSQNVTDEQWKKIIQACWDTGLKTR